MVYLWQICVWRALKSVSFPDVFDCAWGLCVYFWCHQPVRQLSPGITDALSCNICLVCKSSSFGCFWKSPALIHQQHRVEIKILQLNYAWQIVGRWQNFHYPSGTALASPLYYFILNWIKNISSMSLLRNSTVVSCCCRSCLNKWQINYAHILSCQHFALDNTRHSQSSV